jgi:hypothetical protein
MTINSAMRVVLPLVTAILLLSWGCAKKATPPVIYRPAGTPASQPKPASEKPPIEPVLPTPEAKPDPIPEPEKPAPEPEEIIPSSFLVGEENFAAGSYQEAALSYEVFIRENPDHPKVDPANFKLGLAYAFVNDSPQSRLRARRQLRRFIENFPESPYRRQAEFILGLHRDIDKLRSESVEKDKQIKRLAEELERLKKIDLEKRPTRPPC